MMESLFSRATIVTMNSARDVIDDGAVYVNGDRIQDVGFAAELIDCSDRVLIPGLINTHTHLFQTLLKGLGDDRVL